MTDSEFRLVKKFSDLPKSLRWSVTSKSGVREEELVERAGRSPLGFRGVFKGGELLGFIIFDLHPELRYTFRESQARDKKVLVEFAWTNPVSGSFDFKRKYGVTPVLYLFEDLVRKKFTLFTAERTTPKGQQMMDRLVKQNIVVEDTIGLWEPMWKPTRETVRKAMLRRPRLK